MNFYLSDKKVHLQLAVFSHALNISHKIKIFYNLFKKNKNNKWQNFNNYNYFFHLVTNNITAWYW